MIELIGLLLGGVFRLAPELLKVFTAVKDQAHEYKMTLLQLDIDKARSALRIDETHATSNAAEQVAWAQAMVESMKPQTPPALTGSKWIDAFNAVSVSVRPVLTYWHCLVLYTAYKLAIGYVAMSSGAGLASAVINSFSDFDRALVGSMVSYWFLDRSLRNERLGK